MGIIKIYNLLVLASLISLFSACNNSKSSAPTKRSTKTIVYIDPIHFNDPRSQWWQRLLTPSLIQVSNLNYSCLNKVLDIDLPFQINCQQVQNINTAFKDFKCSSKDSGATIAISVESCKKDDVFYALNFAFLPEGYGLFTKMRSQSEKKSVRTNQKKFTSLRKFFISQNKSTSRNVIQLTTPSMETWLAANSKKQITKLYILPNQKRNPNKAREVYNFLANLKLPKKFVSTNNPDNHPKPTPLSFYFRIKNPYSKEKTTLFYETCQYISQWANAQQLLLSPSLKSAQIYEFKCYFSLSVYPKSGYLLAELPLPLTQEDNKEFFPIKSTKEAYSPSIINELTNY